MSYAAAIEQLNSMTPELHVKAGQARRKFSLDEVRVLLAALGNPQQSFRSVLIAGTNGKGSTAATLASIVTASGVRTGLYTSPHLVRPNERIRIDGAEIGDQAFADLYFRVVAAGEKLAAEGGLGQLPSFFETLTAMAFLYFAESKVELAVLEVGMGGRLDATNVVDPLLSIVTDISLDHTEWLGPTITAIAGEKAGILRAGGTLVTLPQHPEANQVLGQRAAELGSAVVNASEYVPAGEPSGAYEIGALGSRIEIDSPLVGGHQRRNVALAVAAAVELAQKHRVPITPATLENGVRATSWPGRLERVASGGVDWILDVAHNPAGAWALRSSLNALWAEEQEQRARTLVFSCLRDKAVLEMAQILFPCFETVVFAPIHNPRAATLEELRRAAAVTGIRAFDAETVAEALRLAASTTKGEPVVVSGSVYLIGEVRPLLMRGASAP